MKANLRAILVLIASVLFLVGTAQTTGLARTPAVIAATGSNTAKTPSRTPTARRKSGTRLSAADMATATSDVPVISLSASCTPDAQGTFTITNIGSDMTSAGSYTLLLNGTPIASNTFQLNAGASTQIHTAGLFGTLELDTSGGGAAPATVSTFCQSPTATPTITPTLAPTIQLSASCTPDAQGTFTITNAGSSMTSAGTYTLLLNGTPIASNTFQLNAGASTQIHTAGLFGTLELDTSGGGTAPATVSTFCESPTATPTITPPTIQLNASCTPDAQGTFTLTNIGSNMTSAGSYTLLLNGTPIASNTFQLNAGASTQIHTSGLFGTLELDTSGGGTAPATVSTFCASPTATPTIAPPTIQLSASCTPDAQGTFTLTNTGSSMTSAGSYTLLLNGTPIATGSFQLNAGASTQIHTAGLFGTLELDTSGGGTAPATVSTFCESPTATPTITPTLAPTIQLSASCTPDAQGTFTISNIGSSMPSPGSYTLLLNGTPIASGTFQLNAGASTQIHTAGLFGTLELDTSGGGSAPATVSTFCASPTGTPTITPMVTSTATITPTETITSTATVTPTDTITSTPTVTPTDTLTATPTVTLTSTPTLTPTHRPTRTPTGTPTRVRRTPTPTPTRCVDDDRHREQRSHDNECGHPEHRGSTLPWYIAAWDALTGFFSGLFG